MKTFTLTDDDAEKLGIILTDCRGVTHYDSLVNSYFNGDTMTTTTELLQAAVHMAEDHKAAAYLANGMVATLRGRISRARHTGHMALNDIEGGHVEALAGAIQDMLTMLEGDK